VPFQWSASPSESTAAQKLAVAQLKGLQGAVVAMDPRSGAILAMASTPSFDPSPLASHDPSVVHAAWDRLNADPSKPFVSKASQQLFPPGSTFKLVTTAAALQNGMTPDTKFDNPPFLKLPQTNNTLSNFGGEHCLGGVPQITLAQALQVSCNVVFGEIGLKLGAEKLVAQAQRFGFDGNVPFDNLPFAEGQIPPASQFAQDLPGVAYSAIGQQSVVANPLQMALIASAIANGGVELDAAAIRQLFESEYERTFGHTIDEAIEVVVVRASLVVPLPPLRSFSAQDGAAGTAAEELDAYSFALRSRVPFRVLDRTALSQEGELRGPAIVHEPTATTYLDAGFVARVHETGVLVVDHEENAE
jgi:hypothetical protein